MSLESWVKNSWLERRASDAVEIGRPAGTRGWVPRGLVSQSEADHCGKMAVSVWKEVEDWIRKNHADKMP
jgi:hypothetical protein